MTKVFLAAGVASLAIAAPAVAGPHGNHGGGGGGGGGHAAFVNRGGGGGGSHGGGGFSAPRAQHQSAPRVEQHQQRMSMPHMQQRSQRVAMERPQRAQHVQMRQQRVERPQTRVATRHEVRPTHVQPQQRVASRQQTRVNRQQAHNHQQIRANRVQQAQNRQQIRENRVQQAQSRQQIRQNRVQQAQTMRAERMNGQNRMAMRQQVQGNRFNQAQGRMAMRQQAQLDRRQGAQNLLAERHALRADRIANADAFRTSRFASLVETPRTRFIAPAEAVRFVGQPVNRVNDFVTLNALPASVSYLYPATSNYYYQYGDGYLYQVDRSTSIIDALIPLLAGGFLPGTYLPQPYMASYVPSYYGLNSWYPASYGYGYGAGYGAGYGGYGYGYPNLCNRYAYGTVYQVDCGTGMVVNVIPTYAGGYGVGQMLPSAYSYYNLPMQYRSMYYPTSDYSYWYAPGAIYQYDTSSSLITSVAALMSPGFSVGQPLPVGYNMYNVPMAYRATYYDTPNAWYRYNNGYIYQVDPSTMLVTSIVASLLT